MNKKGWFILYLVEVRPKPRLLKNIIFLKEKPLV
tara:strand:- start:2403 stop:2504 length:102 start_codon:yes stop_codon:yes gene_type:complete